MLQILNANPNDIKKEMLDILKKEYDTKIYEGDKRYMFISSLSYIISVLNAKSNLAFNQNFLSEAYATGLDMYGNNLNTPRLGSTKSVTKVKFTISIEQQNEYIIPIGTRVTTKSQQIFQTIEQGVIPKGELSTTVKCESLKTGAFYNDIEKGAINILVDPLPYITAVENITISSGGSDAEEDESYRERLKIAESQFSVAGSILAYKYWTLKADPLIIDALITSPKPGEVEIKPILKGGELPQEINLQRVREIFDQNINYPNTTKLIVSAPDVLEFDIDLTYYISMDNKTQEIEIKQNVEKAINDFINYQKTNLNIFLNPDDLRKRILNVGAYRVDITQPTFDKSASGKLTRINNKTINYGGLL